MKRGELFKEKYSQKQKNEGNEIENEIEEKKEEDDNNEDNSNEDTTQGNNEKIEKVEESNKSSSNDSKIKIVYVVKINNIDTSLKIKDINRYFNGYGNSYQKFPSKDGKTEGYGERQFTKKETAKSFIDKYKGISLSGKKQINMVLRKRRVPI